ncbi:hypothetical protein RD1_4124 [Roseobacter denitrificans OCh 114]|uniref:Uncharacterized protein n=1 Tax=Roseobacter denitrificans (strain ATCC 33942 / OCh 114) TaxID=375451 RepID=Q160M8_ROSDO|nr:hypothetical protein RD1_4124 [Roseobacter denitrificans OCh 114]
MSHPFSSGQTRNNPPDSFEKWLKAAKHCRYI